MHKGGIKPDSFNLFHSHPLRGGGDLLFCRVRLPPSPHFVSAHTRKPLLGLFPNICSMHTGPGEFARYFFNRFSVSLTKSKMAAKILCRSLELEPLPGFVSCLV